VLEFAARSLDPPPVEVPSPRPTMLVRFDHGTPSGIAPALVGHTVVEAREPAMQLTVPPDLETLINKRLSSGGYTSIEDVLRRALEAQDAEESWTDEERRVLSAHIEEGYLHAERGELIDGAQARREIQAMKDDWRLSKR
jgi:Arc/MetJ-type ribon-helix-helix transcriptional regulator